MGLSAACRGHKGRMGVPLKNGTWGCVEKLPKQQNTVWGRT